MVSPLHYNWGEGGQLVVTKNFLTITLHFHYFSSLETANTQKSKVFLLRVSLGNLII